MEDAVVEELEHEEEIVELNNLKTHTNILKDNAYKLTALSNNYAAIRVKADDCEKVKESGLVYDGSIFSAATFVATAAVNEKNMFIIGVDIDFFNPVKEEEDLTFEAKVNITSSGKKIAKVVGKINGIAFMQGDFMLLKLDQKSLIK